MAWAACSGVNVPAKMTLGAVVDDGTHGGGQRLIVVQLEVLRSRKGLLNDNHHRIGQTDLAALDNRDGDADLGQGSLVLRRWS